MEVMTFPHSCLMRPGWNIVWTPGKNCMGIFMAEPDIGTCDATPGQINPQERQIRKTRSAAFEILKGSADIGRDVETSAYSSLSSRVIYSPWRKYGRAQPNETSLIPLIAGNKGNLVVRVRNEGGKGIRMTDGNDAHFQLHWTQEGTSETQRDLRW